MIQCWLIEDARFGLISTKRSGQNSKGDGGFAVDIRPRLTRVENKPTLYHIILSTCAHLSVLIH